MSQPQLQAKNEASNVRFSIKRESVASPLPICEFRRAIDSDIEEINYLMTGKHYELFGNKSAEYNIKRCYFSMIALNSEARIVAVICLNDYPNVPALNPSEWELWVQNLYSLTNVTSQNTLWVHLMLCHPDYTYTFTKPLLEKIYLSFPLLVHLIVVVPQDSPIFCFIEENFSCVLPNGYTNHRKVQSLYLTFRHQYTKKYKVRLAVEEDNDDLVPLIDAHSTLLKKMYGEYYITELLIHANEMDRQLIVAELDQRAKAVVILNGQVNYDAIFNEFNMEPYGDLYEPNNNIYGSEPIDIRETSLEDEYDEEAISNKSFMSADSVTSEVVVPYSKSTADLQEIWAGIDEVLPIASEVQRPNEVRIMTQQRVDEKDLSDSVSVEMHSVICSNRSGSNTEMNMYTTLMGGSQELIFGLRESAFTLEVMAAAEEHEDGVYCDLIEAAFQPFPTKEFCVMTVSHTQEHFPLFDFFVKLVPRKRSIYPHVMYILHKNAIKPTLEVHRLKKCEFKAVKNLINLIENCSFLLQLITANLYGENSGYEAFVMVNYEVIVGVMIVRRTHDAEHLMSYYNLSHFLDLDVHKYDRHGYIEGCVLSPIFHKHSKYFLREVHRLSDMSVLFHKLKHPLESGIRKKPYFSLLKSMCFVIERQVPSFHLMDLEGITIPECFLVPRLEVCPLLVSTPRMTSLKTVNINCRLVVVGPSTCGVSFLDTLNTYFDGLRQVNFNHLTLVYDRSAVEMTDLAKFSARMFIFRGNYSTEHLHSYKNKVHVNYMYGTMKSINRSNKYITVTGDHIIPYDYLFLMCGLQYHHPYAKGVRKDRVVEECPVNVFVINEFKQADMALKQILRKVATVRKRNIVIYGGVLHAYCCLATLQRLKIAKTKIKFVEPNLDEMDTTTADVINLPMVRKALHDILDLSDIDVYRNYDFNEWHVNADNKHLVAVKFLSRDGFITLPCDYMFCYVNKQITYEIFQAVYKAGLVYDGKLVINLDCRTNDPFIFAAGSMTKYSRKYFAEQYAHRYFNAAEVGKRLAKHVQAMLLPGGLKENVGDKMFSALKQPETSKLVPRYKEPIILYCVLPGNMHYINVRAPGKWLGYEQQKADNRAGVVLETGNLRAVEYNNDPKYCRIQLDINNIVTEITCFVRQPVDVYNFMGLYGKHEKILNNMLKRYKCGAIKDFYTFFQNSYFCALYYDRFNDLDTKLDQIMNLLTEEHGKSLFEYTINKFQDNDWHKLSAKDEGKIKKKFYKSEYYPMIARQVIKYLTDNMSELTMYAHPLVTKLLLEDVEESPLFK